jgi:hypothetical protein
MNDLMKKTVRALAVAGALSMASGIAFGATSYLPFSVDENSVLGTTDLPLIQDAGKITGNYDEIISFNNDGTFNVSLEWQAGQFVATNGSTVLPSHLTSSTGSSYGLYALYMGSGTVTQVPGGLTTFSFTPGGSLTVFIDPDNNTTFNSKPDNGATAWMPSNNDKDYQIASGTPTSGLGLLFPNPFTCGPNTGINCGSFGAASTFALTDKGKQYFVSPNPFYNISFQSGQLNNFDLSGRQDINGSLDVVFAVPEPTSVTLLGLGMLAAAVSRRKIAKRTRA